MMKVHRVIRLVMMLTVVALVSACASKAKEPTMADRMRGHASDVQDRADLKSSLAKDWDRGQALVATGEKNIRDGQKKAEKAERDLKQAREQVARGQKETEEGLKLVRDAEQQFKAAFPDVEMGGR